MARSKGRQKGYLRQEGPSWIGYWWEDVRDSSGRIVNKRQSQKICSTVDEFTGKPIAKKKAQGMFEEIILDHLRVQSKHPLSMATVEEFAREKLLPMLAATKRRATNAQKLTLLEQHVFPILGAMKLREVTVEHVESLLLAKLKPGAKTPTEGYSIQTVTHIKNAISGLFRRARKLKWYSGELPTEDVELPEMCHKARTALSVDQAGALLTYLDGTPNTRLAADMVRLILLTGLRRGEIVGLRWGWVNLTGHSLIVEGEPIPPATVAVRYQYSRVYNKALAMKGGEYSKLKTANSKRNVPLSAAAMDLLVKIRGEMANKWVGDGDPVFAARNGKPIDPHNELRRKLQPACKALGLVEIGWHDLRHTANTWAGQNGMSTVERKKVFGWGPDEMAMHYDHADMDRMRVGLDKVRIQ